MIEETWEPEQLADWQVVRQLKKLLLENVSSRFSAGHGQLSGIRSQLVQSVVDALGADKIAELRRPYFRDSFLIDESQRLSDFLSRVRSGFHYWSLATSSDPRAMLFNMEADAFALAAKDVASAKEQDLIRARDTAWIHDDGALQAWSGEQSEHRAKAFLYPYEDELRAVANEYCAAGNLISTTLEWALVDALVHARLVEIGEGYRGTGLLKSTHQGQRRGTPFASRHLSTGSIQDRYASLVPSRSAWQHWCRKAHWRGNCALHKCGHRIFYYRWLCHQRVDSVFSHDRQSLGYSRYVEDWSDVDTHRGRYVIHVAREPGI